MPSVLLCGVNPLLLVSFSVIQFNSPSVFVSLSLAAKESKVTESGPPLGAIVAVLSSVNKSPPTLKA